MQYTDVHVHVPGRNPGITAKSILTVMDTVNLEKIAIISWYGRNLKEQNENIEEVSSIISGCPERLYGLAWIEPKHNPSLDSLEKVISDYRYKGFKMIPNGWYPYEDRVLSYCEKMANLKVPCLFHSGILYFETFSSRYCRPVYFEELLKVKNFRFALAHVSWPWTDECLALFGQARSLRSKGMSSAEMFIDITPGTPPDYRSDVLKKLINFGAEDALLFGTDHSIDKIELFENEIQTELSIYKELNFSESVIKKICSGNFHNFFK